LEEPIRRMREGIGESAIENRLPAAPSVAREHWAAALLPCRQHADELRAVPFGPLPVSAELQDIKSAMVSQEVSERIYNHAPLFLRSQLLADW